VPKVSVEHGEQIRSRIVESAISVVSERGFHDATIQDVVADSGLSVGAIYTYFGGKDELFAAACQLTLERELEGLAAELAVAPTVRSKLEIAVRHWFDFLADEHVGGTFMVETWAMARQQPVIREMHLRRRESLVTVGRMLLTEAAARGDIPDVLDLDALSRGFAALLDGLLLQRVERADSWRRATAERHALVFLDLLYLARPGPAGVP
jgi:AcrR family transcriptional regulator